MEFRFLDHNLNHRNHGFLVNDRVDPPKLIKAEISSNSKKGTIPLYVFAQMHEA